MIGKWWTNKALTEYACEQLKEGEIPTHNFSVIWSSGDHPFMKVDSTTSGILLDSGAILVQQIEAGLLEFKKLKQTNDKITEQVIRTNSQQQYRLQLMDGTLIRMNANTTIRFPDWMEGNNRKLLIEGEAYIQLPAAQPHPLFIQTKQATYIVSEGKLNVSTYGNISRLYVEEGKPVQVLTALNKQAEVHPRQFVQVMQYKSSGIAKTFKDSMAFVSDVRPDEILYWKDKQRSYHNKPLIQFVYDMCNWYGLEFKDLACVKNVQINASICYNLSVFESLAIVRRYDSRVTLYQNQLSFCDPRKSKVPEFVKRKNFSFYHITPSRTYPSFSYKD